jgi:arsenate reductase-like glutaredoxin family protein
LENESGWYVLNVAGSKVLSVSSSPSQTQNRLISLSCSMITCHGKTSCQSCLYAYKLFRNRKYKREARDFSATPNKRCNVRFLERSGMEEKMTSERKRRQCEMKKEQRKRDESIEFVGDDDSDLISICKSIPADTAMPSEMKLLWKEQMKQLSFKSPKGHRWDPRFDAIICCRTNHCICSCTPLSRLRRFHKDLIRNCTASKNKCLGSLLFPG